MRNTVTQSGYRALLPRLPERIEFGDPDLAGGCELVVERGVDEWTTRRPVERMTRSQAHERTDREGGVNGHTGEVEPGGLHRELAVGVRIADRLEKATSPDPSPVTSGPTGPSMATPGLVCAIAASEGASPVGRVIEISSPRMHGSPSLRTTSPVATTAVVS